MAQEIASPYLCTPWGHIVSDVFGGKFEILEVCTGDRYLVPILRGGQLASHGFLCGHLGYGGVFQLGSKITLGLEQQVEVLSRVEQALGAPCARLTTLPHPYDFRPRALETTWLMLPEELSELEVLYTSNVRNTLRKCIRNGLRAGLLSANALPACVTLIHDTQRRVGASYLSPEALVRRMLSTTDGFSWAIGVWLGDELIAVGMFLVFATYGAYYLNGWKRSYASLSPNYLMLDQGLRLCIERGVRVVDLGFSHSPSLHNAKRRWGGVPVYFEQIPGPMAVDRKHETWR
jgi:hypothetical protein